MPHEKRSIGRAQVGDGCIGLQMKSRRQNSYRDFRYRHHNSSSQPSEAILQQCDDPRP